MRNLTLYQFIALDDNEKIDRLEFHGVYLDVFRRQDGFKVALFSLYGFYVEVFYDEQKDSIVKTNAFNSYRRLDEYIRYINIEDIYQLL